MFINENSIGLKACAYVGVRGYVCKDVSAGPNIFASVGKPKKYHPQV